MKLAKQTAYRIGNCTQKAGNQNVSPSLSHRCGLRLWSHAIKIFIGLKFKCTFEVVGYWNRPNIILSKLVALIVQTCYANWF